MHNGVSNGGRVNGEKVTDILTRKGFNAQSINAYDSLVRASARRVELKAAKQDAIRTAKPSFLFLRGKKTKEKFRQEKAAIEKNFDPEIAELKKQKADSRQIIDNDGKGGYGEFIGGKKAAVNLATLHHELKNGGTFEKAARLKKQFNAKHVNPHLEVQTSTYISGNGKKRNNRQEHTYATQRTYSIKPTTAS
jgi:hypothetical protein